jgi:hypothetical protein
MSNTLMIAAMETRAILKEKSFATLEEKLRAAMELTKDHWMAVDENERFQAAVGAVLCDASQEDKARIQAELQPLKMLGAAAQGIPVDFSQMVVPENPIGLMKLWHEVKAGQKSD